MGAVGLSSMTYDAKKGELYSVQFNPTGSRAYLTANSAGAGTRVQCRLSIAPVAVHFEGRDANGNPTVVGAAYDNSSLGKQLQIVRFTRVANSVNCKVDSLDSTALIQTSVSTTSAYQNNRFVMFTTQDQSTTVAGTLVTVSTDSGSVRFPLTNKKLSFAVQAMQFKSASSTKDLLVFGTTTDNKRGFWTIDLENNAATAISTLTQASTTTANDHAMYGIAFLRNRNLIQFVSGTNAGSKNLEGFNIANNNQATLLTSAVLNRANVLSLVAVPKSKIGRLQGSGNSANTVIVKGENVFGSSVSLCKFKIGSVETTAALTQVSGSPDASCSYNNAPSAGTVVTFSVSADGVTFSDSVDYTYACTVSSARFVGTEFNAVSGLAPSRAQAPLEVELRDSANRQCLFGLSAQVSLSVAANDNSLGAAIGTTTAAASVSGLATFPQFAIKATRGSRTDAKFATFTITAVAGSARATIPAKIRFYGTTSSTLIGTGYNAAGKFVRYLINPAIDAATPVQLHEYSVASTDSVAIGVSTVDRTNNVMYTLEARANSGVPRIHLRGVAINNNNGAGTAGECVIPDSVTQNTIVGLWHKSNTGTTTSGSVTFVAIAKKSTGALRIIEITRVYGQSANTDCTLTEIDTLAADDIPIGSARYYDGFLAWFTDNSEMEMGDRFSTASRMDGSLLNVVQLPIGTSGTPEYIPMKEIARGLELGFSATDVAPMGNGQFVVSGFNPSTATSVKFLTYHVDTMTNKVVQIPDADPSQIPISPFGMALQHNSDPTDFLLHSVHGDDTTQTLSRTYGQVIGYTTPAQRDYTTTSRLNLIDLQAINEPVAATVSVSGTTATVTAAGIILSSASRCRFNGGSAVQPTSSSQATAVSFPDSIQCTGVPAGSTFVEISNDGTHFSNIVFFSGVNPGETATPSTTVTGNPAAVAGTDSNAQVVFQVDGATTSECATRQAAVENVCTANGTPCTTANCAASTTAITGFRALQQQTGITFIGLFTAANGRTAIENAAAFRTFTQTAAGQAALAGAGVSRIGPVSTATTTSDDDGLTDGEIAGIVIGSIAGVILIGALIAFALKGSSSSTPAPAAAPAATYSTRDATFTDGTSGSYDSSAASGSYDSDSGSYDSEDYSDYSGSSYV
jgi:hypothetical protein